MAVCMVKKRMPEVCEQGFENVLDLEFFGPEIKSLGPKIFGQLLFRSQKLSTNNIWDTLFFFIKHFFWTHIF